MSDSAAQPEVQADIKITSAPSSVRKGQTITITGSAVEAPTCTATFEGVDVGHLVTIDWNSSTGAWTATMTAPTPGGSGSSDVSFEFTAGNDTASADVTVTQ